MNLEEGPAIEQKASVANIRDEIQVDKYGFIQNQDEDDETFNLKVLSGTFRCISRDLFEQQCSKCTYLDKFECLLNPKCTICSRARRISDNGVDILWEIEAWLEREDKAHASRMFFHDS
jgi:hypothetical protein